MDTEEPADSVIPAKAGIHFGSTGRCPTPTVIQIPAPLLLWLSPAFPVGSFAYSHGLEWAAECGAIRDRASLAAWLADLVALGSLRNDLVLLAAAWRSVAAEDDRGLAEVAELAAALQPSAERRLETMTQGHAFLAAIAAAWPCAAAARLGEMDAGEIAYPVAVGVAAAGHGLALEGTLLAFGLAFTGNLVSAAIRLGVIGQTDGQRVLAELAPKVEAAADFARASTLQALGGAAWASDLASLQHETQAARLFRS